MPRFSIGRNAIGLAERQLIKKDASSWLLQLGQLSALLSLCPLPVYPLLTLSSVPKFNYSMVNASRGRGRLFNISSNLSPWNSGTITPPANSTVFNEQRFILPTASLNKPPLFWGVHYYKQNVCLTCCRIIPDRQRRRGRPYRLGRLRPKQSWGRAVH